MFWNGFKKKAPVMQTPAPKAPVPRVKADPAETRKWFRDEGWKELYTAGLDLYGAGVDWFPIENVIRLPDYADKRTVMDLLTENNVKVQNRTDGLYLHVD